MKRLINDKRGFTLIEVIVVIAVVAILAAILTPSVTKNIDDSKRARATNECQVIAASLTSFYKDTGMWPARRNATDHYQYLLYGAGRIPSNSGTNTQFWTGTWGATLEDTFTNQLIANTPNTTGTPYTTTGDFAWRGPYSIEYKADPWGNRYALNVRYLHQVAAYSAVWVLSAGPDGAVNTRVDQNVVNPTVGGDDIVGRMK